MADVQLSCPFCNAQFQQAVSGPRGWVCPACREPLPTNLQAALGDAGAADAPTASPPATFSWANWKIGLGLLMLMVLVGLVALEFALSTIESRRKNDPRLVPASPPIVRQAPTWTALGYLPADVNLVVAVEMRAALRIPDFQKLVVPPRTSIVDEWLGRLEKATGLVAADIEGLVVGATMEKSLPRLTLVLVTAQDFSPEDLAKPLQADRLKNFHGKPFYTFSFQNIGTGRLWCPEKNVIVLVLGLGDIRPQELEQLPFPPRDPDANLPKHLAKLIDMRDRSSIVWAAGQADWQALLSLVPNRKAEPGISQAIREWLPKVRGFLAEVVPGEPWKLQADVEIPDAKDRAKLVQLGNDMNKEADGKTAPFLLVAPRPPQVTGPQAGWVLVQYRFHLADLLPAKK